jgi:hypothetical protein
MTVYECIVAVSAEIALTGISKDRKNEQQGYKFRGIDDVYNALAPIIAKHKLVILPRIMSRLVTERVTKTGAALFNVVVEAEFDFVSAADGSKHVVRTYGEAMDSADKATNKAMSAAYKYAAFQTFCIPTEGDNDADATTHEPILSAAGQGSPASVEKAKAKPQTPAGYDDWYFDMISVVNEGLPALEKAWKASKPEFREHIRAIAGPKWEEMKAQAAAVTGKAS